MALSYPIFFRGSFRDLPDRVSACTETGGRKLCIVTDSNVEAFYLDEVLRAMEEKDLRPEVFTFRAGEQQKNLDTIRLIYEFLVAHHFERSDLLLALGGGVTGDMTGFAAATYLRGMDIVQIPTTLLSQVDSSVGGKTGVDLGGYKNMVGAFHQPRLVYMNMSVLGTLPADQYASGMGEVIKTALIRDRELFDRISESNGLKERNVSELESAVKRCCAIKASIVEEDPYDRGIRAILNFGHTIGHAVEKEKQFVLLHGHCVALGILAACRISAGRGLLTENECRKVRECIRSYGLPEKTGGIRAEDVAEACLSDKKRVGGKLRFVLLDGIGNAYTEPEITHAELLDGIRYILE